MSADEAARDATGAAPTAAERRLMDPAGPGSAARTAPAEPTTSGERPAGTPQPGRRALSRRLTAEIWIVLGLSLGRSGVYAVVSLVASLTAGPPLASQSTALNQSQSPRPLLDLTYQLLSIAFALVPVALALYLLSANGRSAVRRLGLDARRPWQDLAVGVGLAAAIGIPGLGLYAAGRALGITVQVQASALNAAWWTVPVLVFSAVQNALLEEVVAVGYLSERLRELRWRGPLVVAASALLRGSYHLYQGWGPFVGNAVMGVVFAEYYRRRRRVMPLVVAHAVMDMVVFIGYALVPAHWRTALGLS
ncbi:type II CAAX endopeptidase family protein [Cellulomonas sp. NTE-D12]|uniref:CPBP family intramembrane glutamic endopeptidase n=1 Tax=Cellulomonas sp. NTE-D12 TaxID=2962632 RepID=UPI003081576E|nr:CAAX amino protease [Cellulomonas sp. NTE-D12]